MKKTTTIMILVVVIALIAGGVTVTYLLTRKDSSDVRVTVQSIQKIAELATVEYRLAVFMDHTYKSKVLVTQVDSSRMIAYYTGAVRGSVNLENTEIVLRMADRLPSISNAVLLKSLE